jgi:indole-3-glycerol phosphate synthase
VSVLDDQIEDSRRRLAAASAREPLDELRSRALDRSPGPSLRAALSAPGVAVIAEVKRGSPSRGPLAPDLDAATIASRYAAGGASAVSVLTAPLGFGGSLDDLASVATVLAGTSTSTGTGIATLRKDFLIDPYQVWEARAAGASAVLLLAVALDDGELRVMLDAVVEAGLDALLEVHDEDEMRRASRLDPAIVGVNVRDLRDFSVENDRFAAVAGLRPSGAVLVAESGVHGPADVASYAAAGADAVLVGEHLVTSEDPEQATRALVEAGAADGAETGAGR